MNLISAFSESVEAQEWRKEDLKWRKREQKWREQDIQWREAEKMVIALDQKERVVDLKCKAMKSIANLSALVAGFTIVMFVELQVSDEVPPSLVAVYALMSALEVCLMATCMVQSTLMLSAVTIMTVKNNRKKEFLDMWNQKFEKRWKFTFQLFTCAQINFFLTLFFSAWVKFYNVPPAIYAVLVICIIAVVFWLRDYLYYGNVLKGGLQHFELEVDKVVSDFVTNPFLGRTKANGEEEV